MKNRRFKSPIHHSALWLALFACVLAFACKKDTNQWNNTEIPNVPVNITINTALPLYSDLQIPGRWVYVTGGVKGIILVHWHDGMFYALERNCPNRPFDSCSVVTVEDNSVFARCGSMVGTEYKPCCDSRFQLETGAVVRGPSVFGLRNYRVSSSGSLIFINN